MAQDNPYDPARLERLERRLQALEVAEAIRNLKSRSAGRSTVRAWAVRTRERISVS
jgi:hypothetical protein